MGDLTKSLSLATNRKQIGALERLSLNLSKAIGQCTSLDEDDILTLKNRIAEIRDAELWHAIWGALMRFEANQEILQICRKLLQDPIGSPVRAIFSLRLDPPLRYMFKNSPNERDTLLARFLNCGDASLELAAAEELMQTNPSRSLIKMLDIYESAFYTSDHEVIDSIELWIADCPDKTISEMIENRRLETNDGALAEHYCRLLTYRESLVKGAMVGTDHVFEQEGK